jgi:hypothetical protein
LDLLENGTSQPPKLNATTNAAQSAAGLKASLAEVNAMVFTASHLGAEAAMSPSGTKRTSLSSEQMSAFEGKADITQAD